MARQYTQKELLKFFRIYSAHIASSGTRQEETESEVIDYYEAIGTQLCFKDFWLHYPLFEEINYYVTSNTKEDNDQFIDEEREKLNEAFAWTLLAYAFELR